jgi:hypothetical protein
MITKRLFVLIMMVLPHILMAQQAEVLIPKSIGLIKKASNKAELFVAITLPFTDEKLDVDYYRDHPNDKPLVSLAYKGEKPKCLPTLKIATGANTINVIIGNLTEETVDRFLEKENGLSLQFDTDIRFKYGSNNVYDRYGMITKTEANQLIADQLAFPADERTKFMTMLNTMYYYKNKVDFGVQPAQDSGKVSYTLSLDFQNIYKKSSLLKCETDSGKSGIKVYYGLSSRLSTNAKDTLNFLKVYPLIFHTSKYNSAFPYDLDLKIGHESNQVFTNRRVSADIAITTLIPNLVDLTSTESKRLRLKPILGLGFKGYYDYSKGINAFMSGQAYLNAYYYIPVYDRYAIIITDKTFYDFSKERNPKRKVMSTYSVTVGTEIPGTSFKVMVKYEDGKSDINYTEGRAVVLGLIMNLFSQKAK